MKYTLLDMVQVILSSMDSDEVNSIGDNVEAQQVAKIIRSSYFDIVSRANLPETYTLFSLEASGSASKPTLMTIPTTVNNVQWIKYNKASTEDTDPNFSDICFLPLEDFLKLTYSYDLSEDHVLSFSHIVGTSTLTFLYRDDKAPDYFTSFDDNTILFDSYDAEVDTTLQKSKTLSYGRVGETFSMSDTYIPPLDDNQFPLLLNEAKALAFAEMKQVTHAKAEKLSKKNWISLQHNKDKLGQTSKLPNYGRK